MPHSVDGIAGAFGSSAVEVTGASGSSVVELSFLHPEQKSPTAIRQINSNLTSFILCSFHKLEFSIYADLSLRFILLSSNPDVLNPMMPIIMDGGTGITSGGTPVRQTLWFPPAAIAI